MRPVRWTRKRGSLPAYAVLVGLTLAGGALQGQTGMVVRGDPAEGRRLFEERGCVRCHSIWGNGGVLGPDFAVVGAGRSMQQLAGLFWNHTPKMIETVRAHGFTWPTFTETELANVISYIYYVKLFDRPGDPDLGEQWFTQKRCAECHSVGGSGGHVGPALDRYAQYIAPIMLAEGMWNHGPAMQGKQVARGVPIPTFAGREMADIQAYIRRVSLLRDRHVAFLQAPDPARGEQLFTSKGCVRCHGREGRAHFVQFLRVAQGSLKELETHLLLSNRVGFLQDKESGPVLLRCADVGKMLRGLIRALDARTGQR